MGTSDTESEIDTKALAQLLAPEAKLRIIVAVLEEGADDEMFSPGAVYERDAVSKDAWYRYHEDLEAAGMIEQEGKIGNSPVYRLGNSELVERIRDLAELVSES